jgi:hypothetical protein
MRAFPMSILTNRARHLRKPYTYENITVCFSLCDRAIFLAIMSVLMCRLHRTGLRSAR